MWYRQREIEFKTGKSRLNAWAVLESDKFNGPAYNGWLPNSPDSGIYAGDITHLRSNVNQAGMVRVVQPPIKGTTAQQLALESSARDHSSVGELKDTNVLILDRLAHWNDLTPDGLAELNTNIRSVATVLDGARDHHRRQAEAWAKSALGVREKTPRGHINVGATMAKVSSENPALERRMKRIIQTQPGILGRVGWANRIDDRLTAEASRLWLFLQDHDVLPANQVDELMAITWDTLKPINLLGNWLSYEVEVGGGAIRDPRIFEVAAAAYDFHHLTGYMLRAVAPISGLTIKNVETDPNRFIAKSTESLERLIDLLNGLRIGLPYQPLIDALRRTVVSILANINTQNWPTAKAHAVSFERALIYRVLANEKAPKWWYNRTPELADAWAVAEIRNRQDNPEAFQYAESQVHGMDPLRDVPKGPR